MQDLPTDNTNNNNSGSQHPNPFYIDDSTEIDLNSTQEQVSTLKHESAVEPTPPTVAEPVPSPDPTYINPQPVVVAEPVPSAPIPAVPIPVPEPVIPEPLPSVPSPPEVSAMPSISSTTIENSAPNDFTQENVPEWMQVQPIADSNMPSPDEEEGLLEDGNPFAEPSDTAVSQPPVTPQTPIVSSTTSGGLEGVGSESLSSFAPVESVPEALPSELAPEVLSTSESAEFQTPAPAAPTPAMPQQAPENIVPQQMQASDLQGHLIDKRTSHEQLHEVSSVDPTTKWADEEEEEFIVGVEEAHKH
ncbi:MAG: hypothetical protein ACOZAO_01865 [Patescibacteria group bacterium]